MSEWRVLLGDVRETLATLPAASVQTCVTSPPYFGLRDYGMAGQIGLESTPDAYVAQLVDVFRDVRRVLRDDGTVWLNLGDSYAAGGNGIGSGKQLTNVGSWMPPKKAPEGLKPKDLVGIPWMVAFALRADGWYLRSDIIWAKPNPMPESVTDRPTKAHEYLFLLSKRSSYYYDSAAIREANSDHPSGWNRQRAHGVDTNVYLRAAGDTRKHAAERNDRDDIAEVDTSVLDGRNKRSVWTVATQPYPEAHFATFPEALIEPCILAGSRVGDLVLDPFTGSGTTGAVAVRHQRSFVGCELNPAYLQLARERIGNVAPMFASEVAS